MTNDKPVTVTQADEKIGFWLSAALDCPTSCEEFKQDINNWFITRTAHAPSQHSDLADRLEALAVNLDGRFEDAINLCKEVADALRQSPQDTVRRDAWEQAVKAIQDEQDRLDAEAGDYLMDPSDCIDVIRALAKDAK